MHDLDEGIGSIAASKLADLGRALILKARPIIILHNASTDHTVTLKLKRGLIMHTLVWSDDKHEKTIGKFPSAIMLLGKAMNEARKLIGKGYLEI